MSELERPHKLDPPLDVHSPVVLTLNMQMAGMTILNQEAKGLELKNKHEFKPTTSLEVSKMTELKARGLI